MRLPAQKRKGEKGAKERKNNRSFAYAPIYFPSRSITRIANKTGAVVEFKFLERRAGAGDKEERAGIKSGIRNEIHLFPKYIRDTPRDLSSMWSGSVKVQIENHLANLPRRSKC